MGLPTAFLRELTQRVLERRQVSYRIGQIMRPRADLQLWTGALVEEAVRATVLEMQALARRAALREEAHR